MPFLTDEIGRALQTDQAVIVGENEFVYIDNENDDDVVNEVITKENKETKKTTKKTTTKQDEDQNTDNEVVTEQNSVTIDIDNELDDTEIPF